MEVLLAEAPLVEADSASPSPGTLHGTGRQTEAGEDGVPKDPRPVPQAQAKPPWLTDSACPHSPQAAPGPPCPDAGAHRLWPQGWSALCVPLGLPRDSCLSSSPGRVQGVGLQVPSMGLPFSSPQTHGSFGSPVHCLPSLNPRLRVLPSRSQPLATNLPLCPLVLNDSFLLRVFTGQTREQRDPVKTRVPTPLPSGPEGLDTGPRSLSAKLSTPWPGPELQLPTWVISPGA